MKPPQFVDEGDVQQIWKVAANILNKQSRTADKGWVSDFVVSEDLTTPHRKKPACYGMLYRDSKLAGSCERTNESSGSIKGG
jgi:hypothetical protein